MWSLKMHWNHEAETSMKLWRASPDGGVTLFPCTTSLHILSHFVHIAEKFPVLYTVSWILWQISNHRRDFCQQNMTSHPPLTTAAQNELRNAIPGGSSKTEISKSRDTSEKNVPPYCLFWPYCSSFSPFSSVKPKFHISGFYSEKPDLLCTSFLLHKARHSRGQQRWAAMHSVLTRVSFALQRSNWFLGETTAAGDTLFFPSH